MQRIIDNLTRQHHELVRTATEMAGWLDERKLSAEGAAAVHRLLSSLSGILRVHLAMEDRSLYPRLLDHRDAELRRLAQNFLDERAAVTQRYDGYRERFASAHAIEADVTRFVDETRQILAMLWKRMKLEDEVLHPEIVRVFGAE